MTRSGTSPIARIETRQAGNAAGAKTPSLGRKVAIFRFSVPNRMVLHIDNWCLLTPVPASFRGIVVRNSRHLQIDDVLGMVVEKPHYTHKLLLVSKMPDLDD